MKRTAIAKLYDWKEKSGRKPLIIRGARQVGKTWLMKAFAEEAFSRYVYINFEDDGTVTPMSHRNVFIPCSSSVLLWHR